MARAIDLPSEVLPTPGGPTKHRIGPFGVVDQVAHREVLQDAFFDVLEPVVILIEDPMRVREIQVVFALLLPGQIEDPVQVGARYGAFRGVRGDAVEPVDLALGHLAGVVG